MPIEEKWTNRLTHQDRVEVRLVKDKTVIIDFSVQYVAQIQGKWYPIIRFDTAHGKPHLDISKPDGSFEKRNFPHPYFDYRDAFNRAITEVNQRWTEFRQRFEKEMG